MKLTQLTLVILLSLFTFLAFAEETPPISQQALLTLMATPANKPLVLDVRSADEFAEGHIAGAINISHDEINANLSKIMAYKDQTVVVHCRSGRRAISAENDLRAAGFSDLRHLDGDMNAWQAADLPIVK
ncbi:rhodanese-like domain-containing protein [Colwellia polaris]|jgi:rhodanese-related sulfurtransferase|uniref:rhodanese-like domain-containing protein n=1 Tax=Colwellia polaris TaxID=326537 RepID=UPI000A176654|nr:rhodanese-like domain-containing protein [Colwellia polaris]|tara:strand:+ start:7799 stop:8188 length:390 start_codon:yes stop_codon:yes gene_type:complete